MIKYQGNSYSINSDESVLDALLRQEVKIPYACKAGVCHVCVMACKEGVIEQQASQGLREIQIENGYFLSCQCQPQGNISIEDADESKLFTQAKVINKKLLANNVILLKLKAATQIYYRPGQFINIRMNDDHIRSYSLASLPTEDDCLELHIKRMNNGLLSNWLFDDIQINDVIDIQGPFGYGYYQGRTPESDLILIGTGTGLAPIVGILRDALANNHQGNISVYHGVAKLEDFYLKEMLSDLAKQHKNLKFYPCSSVETDGKLEHIYYQRASSLVLELNESFENIIIYLAGSPQMIEQTCEELLARGAKETDIHADPFITKDLRLGAVR